MKKGIIFAGVIAFSFAANVYADNMQYCAGIQSDAKRLQCYDNLAEKQKAAQDALLTNAIASEFIGPPARKRNWYQRRIAAEKKGSENPWVIIPHLRNYILPVTYSHRPNEGKWLEMFSESAMDSYEAKFQLSLKALVWNDVLNSSSDLWVAYTQESWWQVYNSDESAPFRETNYQPELILSHDTDYNFLGVNLSQVALSLNHQSNGRSEPLSRSWNRVIGSVVFEYDNVALALRAWYRIPEHDDDNPEINYYMGYGDLTGIWRNNGHQVTVNLRNNLRSDNVGAVQVDWTFPISNRFKGYIQYFNGYGESLLDYDVLSQRIGIGIALTDVL
ncbi:MAG: phospholipase [Gammaproteobacteria bacterium]|nr:MAG: phospholipase [Gammaproteobacteria bacterium]